MMDPNQKRTITPEQLALSRLDEMNHLLQHIWKQVLPQLEGNFVQALSTAFLQNNALMGALKDKGVLTDEDIFAAVEKAKAEMEKKQQEAQAQSRQQAQETEAAKGPKIVSPGDLENLQDKNQEPKDDTPQVTQDRE